MGCYCCCLSAHAGWWNIPIKVNTTQVCNHQDFLLVSRYFFCGYQIVDNWELTEEQKRLRAMNTFLLALDGDVDFRPEAILKVREVKK